MENSIGMSTIDEIEAFISEDKVFSSCRSLSDAIVYRFDFVEFCFMISQDKHVFDFFWKFRITKDFFESLDFLGSSFPHKEQPFG